MTCLLSYFHFISHLCLSCLSNNQTVNNRNERFRKIRVGPQVKGNYHSKIYKLDKLLLVIGLKH